MPAAVQELCNVNPAHLPRRSIKRLKVVGLDAECHADVDLLFLPSAYGQFEMESTSTIDDLSVQISGYDLAVDVCDFAALYRRGQTPVEDIKAYDGHPAEKEYLDFLRVLNLLTTSLDVSDGKIYRPRDITRLTYKWHPDADTVHSIYSYEQTDGAFKGAYADHWAELVETADDVHTVFNAAFSAEEYNKLTGAIAQLDEAQGETLIERVMVSNYSDDMLQRVDDVVGAGDTEFLRDLEDALQDRVNEYKLSDEMLDNVGEIAEPLINQIEDVIAQLNLSLVDGYNIAGSPELKSGDQVFKMDPAANLRDKFCKKFPYTFAFLDFWNRMEGNRDTYEMNRSINGWYMSNSSLPTLAKAVLKAQGGVKMTVWAVPLMATNSVGFFPDAAAHRKNIGTRIRGQLLAVSKAAYVREFA
ncbi:hypothetical protein [Pseudooctadecabacter jejudonensis]|nr:hypothetical protein [Pseudooctadecabacter jejudonensis]